ncbi:MAG TPA: DCC1-like thiol-disulfide oxidoreductase family protein [Blastocatellia bacterium]|jgi:predicted DCC family thiol-disulfide oxidoreductase YuxK
MAQETEMIDSRPQRDLVLLYDGVCGFCNRSVQTIIKYDRRKEMRFAALQSEYGREIISRHAELQDIDSLILVEEVDGEERVFAHSTGALRVASYLGGWWKLFLIAYIIPRPVRDYFYRLFARYRYRLFGKYDTCPIPSPEIRSRFIK